MSFSKETLEELRERPPERLLMGAYGEMSNRERAVRVYVSLVLAVPFVQLLVTTSPTAKGALIAIASFGLSFAIGWRAGYEALHVGDRNREPVEEPEGDPLAEVEESGSS